MTTAFVLTIPIIILGAVLSHILDHRSRNNSNQFVLGFTIGVLCAAVVILIGA
jgi:hypothetical protein